jgi:hypothetical protein
MEVFITGETVFTIFLLCAKFLKGLCLIFEIEKSVTFPELPTEEKLSFSFLHCAVRVGGGVEVLLLYVIRYSVQLLCQYPDRM